MVQLSEEQTQFVKLANQGHNLLVDACIGSGKTTAIQALCRQLPQNRRVLYLTYNRLLKIDAQNKIQQPNVEVNNYHGFAASVLRNAGIQVGVSELITTVNEAKPPIPKYDLMILDEYQDIETDIAKMLEYVKQANPLMQIIAVGDLQQKIYDKTTLSVNPFIHQLLDEPLEMEFTQCFRLSKDYAAELGRIWNKNIVGVNPDCKIQTMEYDDVIDYLAELEPKDVLCLGTRKGAMADALNALEERTFKYNKNTVFASIQNGGNVYPKDTDAIFTTYDSSKGMERDTCVIFNYNPGYLDVRLSQPNVNPEIIKNIFMVAASRGKRHIIFVNERRNGELQPRLTESDFSHIYDGDSFVTISDQSMEDVYAFKYRESLERAYRLLDIETLVEPSPEPLVNFKEKDGLIDLGPCVKYDLLANYFSNYSVIQVLQQIIEQKYHRELRPHEISLSTERLVLEIVYYQTNQRRYMEQVDLPILTMGDIDQLSNQLDIEFTPEQTVMAPTQVKFYHPDQGKNFKAYGTIDVVKDGIGYLIVCGSSISHDDYLAAALKLVGCPFVDRLVIWNVHDGSRHEVKVPDVDAFLQQTLFATTKGNTDGYQVKLLTHN